MSDNTPNSQSRFFSNISHEMRTPINTIIGFNEMILRENASPEINEDAENIKAASKLLLSLINDVLDMSRFESGQMTLTPMEFNTRDMLADVISMIWQRAKEKSLKLHISVSPEIPARLIGDEVRIKQILINVLNNAVKYTNEGSITLSVECEKTGTEDVKMIYSVADTGIGIRKENIPYLFTAYKRVDEEKNRYIEGTGLGLSIVKQFVDLMGGKITVNSVYTQGSTFIIELPLKTNTDEMIGEFAPERHRGLFESDRYHQSFEAPEARVLIVDDTVSNLLMVTKLLRDTKVQTDTAESGAEALAKTLENKYHVIFMDHLMPQMNGVECLHRIRTQIGGFCRESRVIALTANTGPEAADFYAREGFDGYLVKPVNGEDLERELKGQLPRDLVTLMGTDEEILEETLSWTSSHERKAAVMITTESVADLPVALTESMRIPVISHMVETGEGIFRDGIEIEQQGLLAYMDNAGNTVRTLSPDVKAHEKFFAKQLERANNIIHISISSKVAGSGCLAAMEAAKTFDNVYVVDTGHLSSGQGLMAIEAARMADAGCGVEEILERIEGLKNKIHTSFIVDSMDYLAGNDQVSERIARITRSLMIRPVLVLKNGRMGVGRIYLSSRERAWKKYIASILGRPGKNKSETGDLGKDSGIDTQGKERTAGAVSCKRRRIDNRILFVTYVGLKQDDLQVIRAEIESRMKFEHIYFQKAAPGIAVNCGAGTFGLLYMEEVTS